MALNVFQITALHNNMLVTSGPQLSGMNASEFPLVADNLNGQLARYVCLAGVFDSATSSGNPGSTTTGSWGQANGNSSGGTTTPYRPFGGYFIRGLWYTNEADGTNNYRTGYIGSFVGGIHENQYGHDPNGSSVDYEPIYGHTAPTWPMAATFSTQFRDQAHVPVTTGVITNDASAYSKTRYMPPSTFLVHLNNSTGVAANLSSGNVRVFVEERPSLQISGSGSHGPWDLSGTKNFPNGNQGVGNSGAVKAVASPTSYTGSQTTNLSNQLYPYEYFAVSGVRKLNTRSASLLMAKIFDNTIAYGYPFEEDGSTAVDGGSGVASVNVQTEYIWQRGGGQAGAPSSAQDQRVRNGAYFTINDEYYGFVMDTKCMIFSNKASMIPLLFFDLVDTWTTSIAPRIAGVAVKTTQADPWLGHVYFLSEDGMLADYDFTGVNTNGILSLLTAATAPSANESYGSLTISSDGTKLYALYGTMAPDPLTTSTGVGSPRVAVRPYTIGTDTWGSLDVNSSVQGRINVRHLREMMVLRDDRLAILCEHTSVVAGDTVNYMQDPSVGSATNVAWQLMIYDPSAASKWNTSIINGGTPNRSGQFSNLVLTTGVVTVTASNTYAAGDQVTINGITNGSYTFLNGTKATVLTSGLSGSIFKFNFTHTNVGTTAVSAGRATSGWQYGSDNVGSPGATGTTFTWFKNVNAHLHDVKLNSVLVQGNWMASELFTVVLNAAGGAGPSAASSVTAIGFNTYTNGAGTVSSSILHADFTVAVPMDIRHSRDYATGGSGANTGDRTIFWANTSAPTAVNGAASLYYAPPSFVWDGTVVISKWTRNAADSSGNTNSFDKDTWTFGSLVNQGGNTGVRPQWIFPTQFNGDFTHFVKIDGMGNVNGIPSSSIYGRIVSQTLVYVPTYWKYTAGNWKIADNWTDAFNNPFTVSATPATSTALVWGLAIQFAAGSYGQLEFHTFNVCWGNTKFARKVRYPWAMFAGQTLLHTETRTMSTQNALQLILNETDHSSVSVTGPNTPTNPANGWNSLVTFPTLNTDDTHNNAPIVMEITCANFDPASILNAPMSSNSTIANGGATSQVASAIGSAANSAPWFAFAGNPGKFWRSNTAASGNPYIQMDFGSGKTVLAYSFRPCYNSSDGTNNIPAAWTLLGSNTGAFAGEQTTVDTRTGVTPARGMGFVCNGSTGSFRYYRMWITNTAQGTGNSPNLGMLQFYSNGTSGSMNFVDLSFLPHGSNAGSSGFDSNFSQDGNLFLNTQFARGLKFEVNKGAGYVTITPTWRAHNGYAFSFARQVGVQKLKITCQTPYNYGTGQDGGIHSTLTSAFGPVYTYDYGVSQGVLDNARLGDSAFISETPTNPAAGSFEPNNLGVACDVMTVFIDSTSPNALSTIWAQNTPSGANFSYTYTSSQIEKWTVLAFWDFNIIPVNCYKVHPYYGFIFFEGAGPSNSASVKAGTTAHVTYHWGRRI